MKETSELLIAYIGEDLYKKSQDISDNSLKIIFLRENPLKIRCVIYEKDNLYNIIIDEEKNKIFHECPSILMHETFEGKLCLHLVKLVFSVKLDLAYKLLDILDKNLISIEDSFSKERTRNFILFANNFKDIHSRLEAFYYLNNPTIEIINSEILRAHLKSLIDKNYFLELFYLINIFSKEYPDRFLEKYREIIIKGFLKFFKSIEEFSFPNLLRIIDLTEKILENINFNSKIFEEVFLKHLTKFVVQSDFKHKYIVYYFARIYSNRKKHRIKTLNGNIGIKDDKVFKKRILDIFFALINDLYMLEDVEIMKKQMKALRIPEELYIVEYESYIQEVSQLINRFYLRKLAFLKLLTKKNRIHKAKANFKKINNTFIVEHDPTYLTNKFYIEYLLPHLGFFGEKKNLIKSRDIGQNFYIFERLFDFDWKKFPSVLYFKNKFWGDSMNPSIKSKQGYPLLRYGVDYFLDAGIEFPNIDKIMIVEWDLAKEPINGSNVIAYGPNLLIPDFNHHLFNDLKPFDLCYCKKIAEEIYKNKYKVIEIIAKCSFKDAIDSISKGMSYVEGYYPLSLVEKALKKEISPFRAIQILEEDPRKKFVPHFHQFIHEFKEFLFKTIFQGDNHLFDDLGKISENNIETILSILNLSNYFIGIQIPYNEIIYTLINPQITKDALREEIINVIHKIIKDILEKKEIGSTFIFDLDKMRNTPFSKYSTEISNIRRDEFENLSIYKINKEQILMYDVSRIARTYYGAKILEILKVRGILRLNEELFRKFEDITQKLGLSLNVIDRENNFDFS